MQDISLYHLIKFYAKKWLVIVVLTLLGAGAGFVFNNYIQTPLYRSDSTLLLVNSDQAKPTQDVTLINNYVELFKSRRVLEPIIVKQNLSTSYEDLLALTNATNEKNTQVIKVSIAARDAKTSQSLASAAVESFKTEANKLYNTNNLNVVDSANLPTRPYNVHTVVQLVITTLAGFLLSIIVLFFAYDYGLSRSTAKKTKTVAVAARAKKKKIAPKKKVVSARSRGTVSRPEIKAKIAFVKKKIQQKIEEA